MRSKNEINELETTRLASIGCRKTYTNKTKEYFVYERGKLVAYTDKRVIDHNTDQLVNLAQYPVYE